MTQLEKEDNMKAKMLKREKTVFVAIDYQTSIIKAMKDAEAVEEKAAKLIKGAKILGSPVVVTQQYTKGLGETTDKIKEALGEFEPIGKNTFSAMKTQEFKNKFASTARLANSETVVLFGIEAHVCVMQTALDLIDAGYKVFIPVDCISSRTELDKRAAIQRMRYAGAIVCTCESVLFELLKGAGEPGFKEISQLVK
ncbi:MAG: isochorismatase family protein [Firmicutes bacterium]|nr:isochorismatase family protein [Bacillota bacterium]